MIYEKINSIIDKYYSAINLVKENIPCYCVEPASDFTRTRKIAPDILIDYLVQLQSKSCRSEIADYFVHYDDIPSDSALCQQRAKLLPSALKRVFNYSTVLTLLLKHDRAFIYWLLMVQMSIFLVISMMKRH